ncbi:MAG: hypothetical protein J6E46_08730 [Faecalicoccus sp.]|nr:hypothetical protein [Faecalicoccus sp.]
MFSKQFKRMSRMTALILSVFVVLTLIVNVVTPDQSFSASENRSLAQFPKYNIYSLMNGDYTQKINNWFSDQFVGRSFLVKVKYVLQKMAMVKQIEDVYLGKDMLIEDTAVINQENYDKNLAAINAFADAYPEGVLKSFMLVPNAVSVQSDRLPMAAYPASQFETMDAFYNSLTVNLQRIDVRSILSEHASEYLYYKTDHHWTSLGAYYAFQIYAVNAGIEAPGMDHYYRYTVHNDFKGTLANRTGSTGLYDSIEIIVPKDCPDYIVTGFDKKTASIYSEEGLNSNDPYTVFFSGNTGLISIETDVTSTRNLLVIKDSYANAFIQYLIPYYQTITIIDPRYYTGNINDVMASNGINEVLFLYNYNTYVQDTSLANVLSPQ